MNECEVAIKWTKMILNGIPDSIIDADSGISERIEDIEGQLREFEEDPSTFDAENLNPDLDELKEYLRSSSSMKGKAISVRDRIVGQINTPNGWNYWKEVEPDENISTISFEKGNENTKYESIMYNFLGVEGVRMISSSEENVQWDMFRVDLDNQPSIFIGSVPAWQLDLVSTVPAIEKKLNHRETSRRVGDQNRKKNHWQRQINKNNKNSISAFFDRKESFFANPVIIHMKSDKYVTIDTDEANNNSSVTVSLDFIGQEDNSSVDINGVDQRPFTIIDGQHRVRGAANSKYNQGQRILVVLLPDQLDETVAGKLFAEINTLSKPLKDKHRMFLSHRFWVSSPDSKFTFGKWSKDDMSTQRDRANRLSYQMAARLMLDSDNGFWDDRIKFLDQNTKTQQVLDIEKWVEYSFKWFQDYPYTWHNTMSEDDIFTEIDNYFSAWDRLIGESWETKKVDACLFKSKTQARVMLMRFDQIYEKAKIIQEEGLVTEESFFSILSPLTHVPFTNESILRGFSMGLPEQSWRHLDAWVYDAIDSGVVHSRIDIMDSEKRGVPGAGILARPPRSDTWHIVIDSEGIDPFDGNTRYITVRRPSNCGWQCKPEIWHDGAKLEHKITVKSKAVKDEGNIPVRNRHPLPELEGNVVLRLTWSTIVGEETIDLPIR